MAFFETMIQSLETARGSAARLFLFRWPAALSRYGCPDPLRFWYATSLV
jgi:hypothetical protein